jgi:uncharacterized protein with GYD domain
MPKYLSLFSFKGETLGRLIENPSDREAVVRGMVEEMGGTLESYYVMFGQYDGCVILEAPDSATAAAMVVAVGGSGAFSALETHELLTASQFVEVLEKAKGITSYTPPGA